MSIFNASCLGRMGANPKKSGTNHHNRRACRKGPAQLKKIDMYYYSIILDLN